MQDKFFDCDILILGGGCTGLNFALAYAKSNLNLSLTILEARENYEHDRNWSFWIESNDNFQHRDIIRKTWNSWRFSTSEESWSHISKKYEYVTIASRDFYDKAIQTIKNDKRQTLILGCAVHTISGNTIQTEKGIYNAKIVIDTRNNKNIKFEADASFYQVFYGYEVKTKSTFFDDTQVGLMTEMKNIKNSFSFLYVLPFSKTDGLIEYTVFTKDLIKPDDLRKELNHSIKKLIGDTNYDIKHIEQAVLPMGPLKMDQKKSSSTYIYAGTQAGALRESSGYGFLNIYNWAISAVINLEKGKDISIYKNRSSMSQYLDRHFIKTLRISPSSSKKIFVTLTKKIQADDFVRFMSETNRLIDLIKIIIAVPKLPFLKALFKNE
ncbi:MAG: hypothetical protein GW903_08915 [Alphaproteobacteria bacterium]|nr:hypothetical protein [Alphaproteobacteria bacterium]NCQ88929.1 hypothetical protein [Alphaproteobacteria bacterium]NCT07831.1 hypothetical protein [Alphaproteobacteria bacterium]